MSLCGTNGDKHQNSTTEMYTIIVPQSSYFYCSYLHWFVQLSVEAVDALARSKKLLATTGEDGDDDSDMINWDGTPSEIITIGENRHFVECTIQLSNDY